MQSNYGVTAIGLQWKKQKLFGVSKESGLPNEERGEAGGIVLCQGILDLLPKWRGNWEGLAAQKGISIRGHDDFLAEGRAEECEAKNSLF